jgi:hypothetical protein
VHDYVAAFACRPNLDLAERRGDALDAVWHRPSTFRTYEGANPPSALLKTPRDVPPDKAGGASQRDGSYHESAF